MVTRLRSAMIASSRRLGSRKLPAAAAPCTSVAATACGIENFAPSVVPGALLLKFIAMAEPSISTDFTCAPPRNSGRAARMASIASIEACEWWQAA